MPDDLLRSLLDVLTGGSLDRPAPPLLPKRERGIDVLDPVAADILSDLGLDPGQTARSRGRMLPGVEDVSSEVLNFLYPDAAGHRPPQRVKRRKLQ